MPTVRVGDIQMAYDDVGEGLPLILIHGSPFNRSMWRPQVEYFRSQYRLIVPDLRGYGDTTVVAGKTTLEDFAGDIVGLLDYVGVARGVVVGLSMGGLVAQEFYQQFPQRVSCLVLADTYAHKVMPDAQQTRFVTAERIMNEGMQAYAQAFLPKMIAPHTIERQPEIAAQVMSMMANSSVEGVAAALRGRAERRDYVPLLADIAVPTLIVVGRDDEMTPVSDSELMHRSIDGSQLVVIEGAGHLPNLEQTETFNAALGAFLKGI